MAASPTAKCIMVQGGRSTLSLSFLGPSCTSFLGPNPAEQEMNPMKVLRPDSVESLGDSSFSAGTEQPLPPGHPSVPEQSQVRVLSRQPQRRKSPGKQATIPYFSIIPAGEQDFFLEEPNRARAGAPQPGVSVEGRRDMGTSSTTNKPTTRRQSGIWGQQSAGDPKACQGQCWSPGDCSQ